MSTKKNAKEVLKDVMNTEDKSSEYDKKSMTEGKTMAILSYIIPFIPYFVEKDNKYVKFHARQGMDLLLVGIAYSILYNVLVSVIKVRTSCGSFWGYDLGNYCRITPWWVILPLSLVGLCISAIAIIGIINAVNGKAKVLPLIGKYKVFK